MQCSLWVEPIDTTLLGASLFPGSVLDQAWPDRCDDLFRAVKRLRQLGSHDALTLLRSSFSDPKILHLLHCSPSVSHSALDRFDSLLRSSVQSITNSDLSDIQWLQASLPVRDGGLGVKCVSFWRLRQAHSSSRAIFLLAVHTLTIVHCSPIFPTGHQLLVMSLTFYRQSNLSGTVRHFSRPSSGDVQFEHAIPASLVLGCLITT